MTDATELDEAAVRAAVEGADARQWAEEWWRCHADDWFRAGLAGCPELVEYFTTITPATVRLLLAALDEARAEVEQLRADKGRFIAQAMDAESAATDAQDWHERHARVLLDRAEAAESALAAVRSGLSEALDELVECRSFISVETRHYPTVGAINEVVERLRPLAHLATAEEGSDRV